MTIIPASFTSGVSYLVILLVGASSSDHNPFNLFAAFICLSAPALGADCLLLRLKILHCLVACGLAILQCLDFVIGVPLVIITQDSSTNPYNPCCSTISMDSFVVYF